MSVSKIAYRRAAKHIGKPKRPKPKKAIDNLQDLLATLKRDVIGMFEPEVYPVDNPLDGQLVPTIVGKVLPQFEKGLEYEKLKSKRHTTATLSVKANIELDLKFNGDWKSRMDSCINQELFVLATKTEHLLEFGKMYEEEVAEASVYELASGKYQKCKKGYDDLKLLLAIWAKKSLSFLDEIKIGIKNLEQESKECSNKFEGEIFGANCSKNKVQILQEDLHDPEKDKASICNEDEIELEGNVIAKAGHELVAYSRKIIRKCEQAIQTCGSTVKAVAKGRMNFKPHMSNENTKGVKHIQTYDCTSAKAKFERPQVNDSASEIANFNKCIKNDCTLEGVHDCKTQVNFCALQIPDTSHTPSDEWVLEMNDPCQPQSDSCAFEMHDPYQSECDNCSIPYESQGYSCVIEMPDYYQPPHSAGDFVIEMPESSQLQSDDGASRIPYFTELKNYFYRFSRPFYRDG